MDGVSGVCKYHYQCSVTIIQVTTFLPWAGKFNDLTTQLFLMRIPRTVRPKAFSIKLRIEIIELPVRGQELTGPTNCLQKRFAKLTEVRVRSTRTGAKFSHSDLRQFCKPLFQIISSARSVPNIYSIHAYRNYVMSQT